MFNEGYWCFKITLVILLFVVFHFVSNSFFEDYAEFAKYGGGVYMILQSIIIIDLSYIWSINWRKKFLENTKNK